MNSLLAMLKEAEQLLQFPSVQGHYEKASQILVSIARRAPTNAIAQLAMKAVSRAYHSRNATAPDANLNEELWRLRDALRKVATELNAPKKPRRH